jgi:hypothetical protein
MITYGDILFLIITAALFFQGFYFAKKQMWRVVILSLILIISDKVSILLSGVYTLQEAVSVHDVVWPIIYVVFWWGLGYVTGYIIGHLILIRRDFGKVKRVKLEEIKHGEENDGGS